MAEKIRLPTFQTLLILSLLLKGCTIASSYGNTALPDTKLHCTSRSMDLVVKSTSNQSLQLSLINSTCKATRLNNTHVLFQAPLTECGTQHKIFDQRVVFFNWLIIKSFGQSRASERSRAYRRSMPFHCVYTKNDVAGILRAVEPLNLDKGKSSPKEMISLLGLPVKIQCTFRNGAWPVTVKFFKNQAMVAKATSLSIEREILMATKEDFGGYSCMAIDGEGRIAKHNITIKQLDRTTVSQDGVSTKCSETSFHVIMNRTLYPWLLPAMKHLHLRDHVCEPWHINNTHIILNSSYDQCKTIKKESYGETIYDNVLVVHVKPRDGLPVLNAPDVEFAVECRLKRIPKTRITVTSLDQGKVYYLNYELFGIFRHGGTVRAVCETDSYEGFVTWKYKNRRIPPRKKNASNNILLVENVTDNDGGVYVCVTTRRHLTFHFFVEAHFHAKSKQYVRKGKDGVVVCSVGGFPKVTKTWTKNANSIEMKSRYSINEDGNLMISEAQKEDSGMYACEMEQVFQMPLRMRKFQEIYIMVEVYEPLVLDRHKTSRKQIKTFKGLKTNIICSFQHGATPISITLTKKGQNIKSNGSLITVKRRTLYALLETREERSFGKYECVAKDAVGRKIQYVMNLGKIGKNDFLESGLSLDCHEDYMDVTFNLFEYPYLDPKNYHIHLNSSVCEPYEFTNTHIRIQAPLTGCGTIVRQHGHVTTYSNSLVAHLTKKKRDNRLITRVPDIVFPFKCAYERKMIKKETFQVPVDSLKVDALRSSPLYVTSLVNIRLRLTCAFKGGILPLKINMIKDGKRVAEAEKVDENTLTAVVRANFSAVGTYECYAVGKTTGQKATHKITLGLTDWKKIPKRGISVQCDPHSMSVTLDRRIYPWIHPEFLNIHLIDHKCKPYFTDSTHVFIRTPLKGCGTSYKKINNHVLYRNKLMISEHTERFQVVAWSPVVVLPIECRFEESADGGLIPRGDT